MKTDVQLAVGDVYLTARNRRPLAFGHDSAISRGSEVWTVILGHPFPAPLNARDEHHGHHRCQDQGGQFYVPSNLHF